VVGVLAPANGTIAAAAKLGCAAALGSALQMSTTKKVAVATNIPEIEITTGLNQDG
jgi:hypothetical protein